LIISLISTSAFCEQAVAPFLVSKARVWIYFVNKPINIVLQFLLLFTLSFLAPELALVAFLPGAFFASC
jgi:hypothetical protein